MKKTTLPSDLQAWLDERNLANAVLFGSTMMMAEAAKEDPPKDDVDDDEDDDDDEAEGLDAPGKQALSRMKASRTRARNAAKAAKTELETFKAQAAKDADANDAKTIRAQVESEMNGKYKPMIVRGAAKAALLSAGLVAGDAKLKRALRLLDMDELDVDKDGEVDGLDEQIEEIKEEFPELFGKGVEDDDEDGGKTKPRRPRQMDGPARRKPKAPEQTPVQKAAAQLLARTARR